MSDGALTEPVALSTVRRLAGTENYPFHLEGELRMADVLIEHTAGVTHARLTVDEFEGERCPSVENLRNAAKRLAELCHCGKALWAHREGSACQRFAGKDPAEEGWKKGADGSLSKFRQSMPMLPGVPWEVCLMIEALRIAVKDRDSGYLDRYACYAEAIADLQAGRDPDPAVVERIYRREVPWGWPRLAEKNGHVRMTSVGRMASVAEALNEIDRGYEVPKEVDVA